MPRLIKLGFLSVGLLLGVAMAALLGFAWILSESISTNQTDLGHLAPAFILFVLGCVCLVASLVLYFRIVDYNSLGKTEPFVLENRRRR